ncbi:MAG: type II toxin-antitoxin system VapC family toxin [Chthoniobacterales bacterium]|nr:type II toxin-antitoxin system VapC family toxin [Chthoniobacterales bacterium]
MPWVVDTCLLIDVADADPRFGEASSRLLAQRQARGLIISPVSFVELAPAFEGVLSAQEHFLANLGVDWGEHWTWPDTRLAFDGWATHVRKRRPSQPNKRPIADVLIGAFAQRFDGLLTRNARDFQKLFPTLRIEMPN